MLACLDVYYRDDDSTATAAAVVFHHWQDEHAIEERVIQVPNVEPYESGQFYRRELPCLLAVLGAIPPVEAVIIDSYVWLDGPSKPGLGAHLYEALDKRVPVIGVAKTKFQGASEAREITRGASTRPLIITAIGIPLDQAASHIQSMHGDHRLPTLLKRADHLSRQNGGATLIGVASEKMKQTRPTRPLGIQEPPPEPKTPEEKASLAETQAQAADPSTPLGAVIAELKRAGVPQPDDSN